MPVTLSTEQTEQRRWKLRPQFSGLADFDVLVAPDGAAERQAKHDH